MHYKKGESLVKDGSVALIAFGGNAFIKNGHQGSIEEQREAASQMCSRLLTVIEKGYEKYY